MLVAALAALWFAAAPGPKVYDFDDPKKTNAVAVTIDSPMEPIVGFADGITGTATFDPAHPERTTGRIDIAVASLTFPNDGYSQSARNYGLRAQQFPTLSCVLQKIVSGKIVRPGVYEGRVRVAMTMKGVTKPLTIPLSARYFPGAAKERDGTNEGDLLVVRSTFTVRRSDFGIARDLSPALVSDDIELRIALVGTSGTVRKQSQSTSSLTLTVNNKPVPIAERMAFHKVPGCTIAVIKDFRVAWTRAFGTTGNDDRTLVTDQTLFPVGALGGPVATAIALAQVEKGTVALDTDINAYLKRWKSPGVVTIRQLITQRSGFTYPKYLGYDPDAPLPTLAQVLRGEKPAQTPPVEPTVVPGTRFVLAAENATVLQCVLEDATGKDWNALLQQTFGRTESFYLSFPPTRTYGRFAKGFDESGAALPGGGRAYPELAASGLWVDTSELSDFLASIMACAAGKSQTPLSASSARLLFETIVPVAESRDGERLAFGENAGPAYYLFRGGNAAGYYAQCWLDERRGDGIVVLTNRNLCWQFANEIRDTLVRQERILSQPRDRTVQ
jgi:CubicO group peptidase (beta-lactamase class C family)/polyisoprenoid-binding protein YceI